MDQKRINRNRIYRLIAGRGAISQSEIVQELCLSRPTVTQNLASLKELGLITESGSFASTGGRRARVIECNAYARVAIGMDLTRNHVGIVLVDLRGNVIDGLREKLSYEDTPAYYERLKAMLETVLTRNQVRGETILGLGISIPAILDGDQKTVTTALVLPFAGNLYDRLTHLVAYPVLLYNDANSGGYAEFWEQQAGKDMFYCSLSATVGGMFLSRNRIYEGEDYRAAEVGHMTIVPDGPMCYCGQRGCVDALCASTNLSDMTDGDLDRFFKLVEMREPLFRKKWNEYLNYLAITVNNVRMLLDCDVILGGYVGNYMEPYLPELKNLLQKRDTFNRPAEYVKVCRYHNEAAAVGAGLMFVDQFIHHV